MPRSDAANAPRRTSSGAIRPAGLAAATLTAAAVFILGLLLLPPIETEEPPPPPPPPPAPVAAPPPPPPAPATPDAASGETPHPDATAVPPAAPAPQAAEVPAPSAAAPPVSATPSPTKSKPAATSAATPDAGQPTTAEAKPEPAEPKATSSSRDKSPDKEVAREAWRKNLPDITSEAGKAAILIPIKGSIDGATYHVTGKPKSVLVTLPKGESMITMPFYNLRRDGYRQLWIKKDDATGTTTIRIVLGDASDPQVEIKEDFVRVVVRRSVDVAPSAPAPAAAPESAAPEPAPPVAAPSPAAHD